MVYLSFWVWMPFNSLVDVTPEALPLPSLLPLTPCFTGKPRETYLNCLVGIGSPTVWLLQHWDPHHQTTYLRDWIWTEAHLLRCHIDWTECWHLPLGHPGMCSLFPDQMSRYPVTDAPSPDRKPKWAALWPWKGTSHTISPLTEWAAPQVQGDKCQYPFGGGDRWQCQRRVCEHDDRFASWLFPQMCKIPAGWAS